MKFELTGNSGLVLFPAAHACRLNRTDAAQCLLRSLCDRCLFVVSAKKALFLKKRNLLGNKFLGFIRIRNKSFILYRNKPWMIYNLIIKPEIVSPKLETDPVAVGIFFMLAANNISRISYHANDIKVLVDDEAGSDDCEIFRRFGQKYRGPAACSSK